MAQTLPYVRIPFNTWVDLYAETGLNVGTQITIQNIGSGSAKLVESDSKPNGTGFYLLNAGDFCNNSPGNIGAWVYSKVGTSLQVGTVASFKNSSVDINMPLSAFGDLRTVELTPQFQATFEYTVDNSQLNTNAVTGGGSVTQSDAMAVVATSTTTSSSSMLKSVRHAKYRAGFGGVLRFTTLFSPPVAGTVQLVGLMDELGVSESFKNGVAVGSRGLIFGLHIYSNDTVLTIPQFDFDNPITDLDTGKLNVWFIEFEYLGAGAIRLWREQSDGSKEVVHTVRYANKNTAPSSFNPNYHYIMFADNAATTNDMIIKSSSYAYMIEGKTNYSELHQPKTSTGIIEKTSVSSEVAIFTIRNKSTYASKTNFIDVILQFVSISYEANNASNLGNVRLIVNATLGGTPSFSDIDTNDSVLEIDTAGTTVTGGREFIDLELSGKNDRDSIDLTPFDKLIGPGDALTVSVQSDNPATFRASLVVRELF